MKSTKLISLFALLFIAVSNMLWSADDDIVWLKKGIDYDGVTLFNNNQIVAVYTGTFIDFLYTENGEKFHTIPNANRLIFINNDTEYLQISNDRKYLVKFKTDGFIAVDSMPHDVSTFNTKYLMSRDNNNLYEVGVDKIRVWDIAQKKVVREMLFPKYDEPNLYSHEISSALDCNNEKIIVQHTKQFRPESNPNTWYSKLYINFYSIENLDSLESMNITGGSFSLSSTCKYFTRIQGGIDLYDFKTLKLLNSFKGAFYPVFTSDDKYLIAVDPVSTNQMQVWDIAQNKLMKTIKKGSSHLLAITEDSKFAYCGNGNDFFKLRLNIDPNSIENENTIFEDIKSYPNPTNNKINFELKLEKPDIYNLKIVDLNGKEVLSKHLGNLNIGLNKIELQKENLSKGRYSVIIYSQNNSIKYNIIIGE